MAKHSKVVISNNQSNHKSRLAKSFQQINNLADYSTKPSGVWGSTATIKSGDVTIKSTDLDFEFNIPFDDDLESNEGEIIVYNLSDNTISHLNANQIITIEAGYEGDTGVLFKGTISKVKTVEDSVDKTTTIKVIDKISESKSINLSYKKGTKASYILKELLKKTGLAIADFQVGRDFTYSSSVSIDESLSSAIKKYSEECAVKTFSSNGVIFCRISNSTSDIDFNVSEETGMIGSPSQYEEQDTNDSEKTIEGYEIEMLLQHRAAAGRIINLTSKQYKGKYTIKSGTHRFNESEATTTIKVV